MTSSAGPFETPRANAAPPPPGARPGQPSTPAEDAERIVSHSLGGARWMLWLSGSALAFGFGTNVVLGRIGPELLGFYGFLTLTVSLVSVFFVLGGANVLINYLPKRRRDEKLGFLLAYGGIALGAAALFLGVAAAFPVLLDVVYGTVAESSVLGYVALFVPLGVLQTLAWSALQADLDLRVQAVSQQLVSSVNFAFLAIVAVGGWLDGPVTSGRRLVLVSMLIANAASLGVALWRLSTRQFRAWGSPRSLALAPGFWRFNLFFHASTLAQFAVRSLDQVYVLRQFGFAAMGYYRGALVLAQLGNFILVVTDRAFYSTFCNVDPSEQPRLHARFVRLNAIGSALVGVVLLTFSRELLTIFGESVTSDSQTLLLLLGSAILLAFPITSVNNALVAARERMNLIFVNNVIGAVAAWTLYETFARSEVVGVGWAFAILQLLMLFVSSVTARRATGVPFSLTAAAVSAVAVAVGVTVALVLDDISPATLALKVVACAAFVPLLLAARLVTVAELRDLAVLMVPGYRARESTAAA